jgi:4,5-DOPA dioxygenase extradiol
MSESTKAVFIGHGSPMNAISKNAYSDFLIAYASTIKKPEAIVVISAHWLTNGTYITGNAKPEQIYDFYGFQESLYTVQYSPPGSTAVAETVSREIGGIKIDPERGIDHAGWAVVKHMFPDQSVPLLEISLDMRKTAKEHFSLGQKLGRLREHGILFLGSGNLVHNLRDVGYEADEKPFQWALDADAWLAGRLNENRINELVEYETYFPNYKRSIPTNEHYLPLLYILGMREPDTKINTLYEEIQNGSISMRSIEV